MNYVQGSSSSEMNKSPQKKEKTVNGCLAPGKRHLPFHLRKKTRKAEADEGSQAPEGFRVIP